ARLELSRDGGASFEPLAQVPDEGRWRFDTRTVADGQALRVRVTLVDAAGNESLPASSAASFEIDNTAPAIASLSPNGGEVVGGVRSVTWTTADANPGSALVELSLDGGASWQLLASAAPSGQAFAWSTTAHPDSARALLRL